MSADENKVEEVMKVTENKSTEPEVVELDDVKTDVVEIEKNSSDVVEIGKEEPETSEMEESEKPRRKKKRRKKNEESEVESEGETDGKSDDETDEEDKPVKKRRKKRKKESEEANAETEQEGEEVSEEGGDPWSDDDSDNLLGDDSEKHTGRGLKIFLITLAAIFGVVAAVYLGFSIFFMSHFYYATTVNGVNFSMKSEKAVEDYMKSQVKDYQLSIEEKNNITETIDGTEIDLAYVENGDVKKAIKSQNAFLWPRAFFSKSDAEVTIDVSYDKDKLQEKINALKCVTATDQVDPTNAYPKYENGKYTIEPETTGTKVDMDRLTEEVNKFVSGFQKDLNMEDDECYLMPKFTSESPEVQAACDTMNNYCKASITYDMSPATEVVNADVISTWLTYDDAMNVTFNTDAVTQYMADLGAKYDTVGKSRTITTPGGKTAEVSGGTYGWSIDEAAERDALIASIQAGEVVTKTPAYEQTAATHDAADWGSTYLEVDLSSQHMWYVVGGGVALETDVVTGDGNDPNKVTPSGVYEILEMQSPSILKGEIQASTGKPEYETEVAFWMRVTWSGIGFHDATWQSAFGGSRYVNGYGSHGCINMPYNMAQSLYGQLGMGTPVIIHY